MNGGGASRTALAAALMRAAHSRLDRSPLLDDPWGDRLVSAAEKHALYRRALDAADRAGRERLQRLGSEQAVLDAVLRAHPTYGGVILRSRFAEDALRDAVCRGASQYVIVGAGLDSFIVRQPGFARALQVFEIDHPSTQAVKRQRLAAHGVDIPANVHFVAADLAVEPLAVVLARCGLSRATPAFFSWLGVTVYLSREANLTTLRGMATSAAPGSEIVFTYIDARVLDGGRSAKLEKLRASVAASGEPWVSGFNPVTLASELSKLGLVLVEDLGHRELTQRYYSGRTDGLSPGLIGHVARVRVGAP